MITLTICCLLFFRHRKPPGVPTDKTLLLVTKASDTSISSSVSAIAVADERTTSLLPLVLTKG